MESCEDYTWGKAKAQEAQQNSKGECPPLLSVITRILPCIAYGQSSYLFRTELFNPDAVEWTVATMSLGMPSGLYEQL